MTKIGRQTYIALGVEGTPGSLGTVDDWFVCDKPDVKEIAESVIDNAARGVLANAYDERKVKKMTEANLEGFLGDRLIGYLLLGAMGASAAPSTLETSVYSHVFSESNVNTKPSFSLYVKDTDNAEVAKYMMINTLELNFVAGAKAKYKAQLLGQKLSDQASTPAVSAENPLDTHDISLKYAANIAGLGAGTAFYCKEFNLLFENNVMDFMANGSVEPNKMYNQTFRVSGDFTLPYTDDVYRDFNLASTEKAIRIHLENTDNKIGATEYPSLTLDLSAVAFTNWEVDRTLDEIVMQKISFEAEYCLADSKVLSATLVNTKSTQYA